MSEEKHTSTSLAWVTGTKFTLQGRIDQHSCESTTPNPNRPDLTVARADDVSRLDALILPDRNDEEECGSEDEQDFEPIDFGSSEMGALSVTSDEESREDNVGEANSRTLEQMVASSDDEDVGSDFEPLQSSENDPDLAGKAQLMQEEPISSEVVAPLTRCPDSEPRDGEDDSLLLKLGGGLAVVGAVVGGVALAAAHNGSDDHRRRKSNRGQN